MRSQATDGTQERKLLIAAITSTDFLARAVPAAGEDPFRSKFANLVWSWCCTHYRKYSQCPGKDVEGYYAEWAASGKDVDTTTLIDRLLASLSGEYEKSVITLAYALDIAERHWNDVLLEKLQEEIALRRSRGQVDVALAAQQSFRKLDLHSPPAINVLEDTVAQKQAFSAKQNILVKYPGPAGEFFGDELSEDSFVAFMASAKGMKSHTLLDVAWRAMLQGKQVAYFQVGDLSRDQIMQRFQIRAARRPAKAKVVRKPTAIMCPPGGMGQIAVLEHEEKVYEEDIAWEQAERAYLRLLSKTKGRIHLFHHPIKTVSVSDIRSTLEFWDREVVKAEVVVIDYAGNLAAVDGKANAVEQVSHTWAMMRQISEVRRCLVVTAQQSNKEGFRAYVLTRNNFSDSKMILAHVTAFCGINMTDEEKSRGIIRYNFVVRRGEQFSESYCLHAAHCLDIGNPVVVSALPEKR